MRITPISIRNEKYAKDLLTSLGVSPEGVRILTPKSLYSVFKIEGIKSWEANVIKQHLLALGSDAAIERAALVKNIKTDILIFGSLSQLRKLIQKLSNQPFNLKEIAERLSFYLDGLLKKEFTFYARDKVLKIKRPVICGIINATDDSFSGDGLYQKTSSIKQVKDLALEKTAKMLKDGAKIIDIGGESSRPFSKRISEREEIKRVIPLLKVLRKKFKKTAISVDTYKYNVAKAATDEGADIINDITALRASTKMASLIKKYKLGCVLMHMKGKPSNMQVNPKYKDVMLEELNFFKERLGYCEKKGIDSSRILIDPGIGFGKRVQDNLRIINELYKLKVFGLPIFLGLSRKSFIGKILNVGQKERLVGTVTAGTISIMRGADILRVHDVARSFQALKITSKITEN